MDEAGPLIHSDVSAALALAATDENRPSGALQVGFSEGERLGDPKTGSPEHDDEPTQPPPVHVGPGLPHYRDDLLDSWRIGGSNALFLGRGPLLKRFVGLMRAGSVGSSIVPPLVG